MAAQRAGHQRVEPQRAEHQRAEHSQAGHQQAEGQRVVGRLATCGRAARMLHSVLMPLLPLPFPHLLQLLVEAGAGLQRAGRGCARAARPLLATA